MKCATAAGGGAPLRARLCAVATLTVVAAGGWQALGAPGKKAFENRRYSYSVAYPGDWFLDSAAGRFQLLSFPPEKAARAVLLPEGGAAIFIFVPSQIARSESDFPQTLDDWVKLGTKRQRIVGRRAIEVKTAAGLTAGTEIRTVCCAIAPFQESAEWFFMTGGRYFEAETLWWQGDADAQRSVEVMAQIVGSLRVLGPESRIP